MTSEINTIELDKDKDKDSRSQIKDITDENDLFDGSTHSYLIYFNPFDSSDSSDSDTSKNVNDFILGIITMSIQFVLYSIMIKEGFEEMNGSKVPVITDWDNCDAINYESDTWTGWGGGKISETASLTCQSGYPEVQTILGGFTLSCILLVYFIAYDLLACIKIWFKIPNKWSKIMGFIIFLEALLAFFTGVIFAFIAVNNGSSYDAIVNCIGVLFVHDLDEKMYEACELIKTDEMTGKLSKKFCCCCQKCMKCACIICVLIISIIIGLGCVSILFDQQSYKYDSDT